MTLDPFHGHTIENAVSVLGSMRLEKKFRDGTHRAVSPDETLSLISNDLDAYGITRVARLTGLDRLGTEVFAAFRPNSRGLSVSQGKGATADAARLSAIMEAIECFHAEHCRIPLRYASIDEMTKEEGSLNIFAPRSHGSRAKPILWAMSTDLISRQNYAVPFDFVHSNFLQTDRSDRVRGVVSTNGLASGGNLAEALTHGICEVIERRGTDMFNPAQSAGCIVPHETIEDRDVRALLDGWIEAGCAVKLWHTAFCGGPASFIACLSDLRDKSVPPGYGGGCHLSPTVALTRALHEAAQARLTRISGARDDLNDGFFGHTEAVKARFLTTQEQHPHDEIIAFHEIPDQATACLFEDLSWLISWADQNNFGPVLAVDIADDPRFRVVKVLMPACDPNLDAGHS